MTVQELLQVLLMMDILQMNDICMRTVQVLIIHLLTWVHIRLLKLLYDNGPCSKLLL